MRKGRKRNGARAQTKWLSSKRFVFGGVLRGELWLPESQMRGP
jgi:hypothetical protein